LDNNSTVINTLGTEITELLSKLEEDIFRVRNETDFDAIQKSIGKIMALLTGLRRSEPEFLQFIGGLLLIYTNLTYDETFQHNLRWYDIGDDGRLTRGQEKRKSPTGAHAISA